MKALSIGLAALLCSFVTGVCGEIITGRVVAVADGDTLTVLDSSKVQHKIRLNGIDAPERKQAFGTASRQSLAELAFQKTVFVEYSKTDRYGRLVGKILVDGHDVNLEQLSRGMAWYFRRYASDVAPQDRASYTAAEAEAKGQRRGLWRDAQPVAPWDWRKTH